MYFLYCYVCLRFGINFYCRKFNDKIWNKAHQHHQFVRDGYEKERFGFLRRHLRHVAFATEERRGVLPDYLLAADDVDALAGAQHTATVEVVDGIVGTAVSCPMAIVGWDGNGCGAVFAEGITLDSRG